jgi:uncharacterized membrane protein YvbJ
MSYCTKCGNELKEGAKFCVYCGEKLAPAPQPAVETPAPVEEVADDVLRKAVEDQDYKVISME